MLFSKGEADPETLASLKPIGHGVRNAYLDCGDSDCARKLSILAQKVETGLCDTANYFEQARNLCSQEVLGAESSQLSSKTLS